ncbi:MULTISPECIES: DNA (cytosine-5-)-methyltransferase [unclassified Campylobacter]|uniref:DNA cytosine methyltransferase n=1 Tax=unclassified Campylobacter TaxID=2593542 RepID=UPI001EFC017C|nr:DNA (cytosine-5-)-methyltransferase [Campylobacter sp. RM12651]MBZ7976593.1 DNA (cytosine-5-)-methyltransferase [Campylobacter sp. RM12637]ULO04104.1 type IIS restriction/modification system, cytosine-specific DNA methyltransferase [Campylobacter sp. RM12651]
MKVVSLFSGIGGFEEGIKQANIKHKLIFSSEIDNFAQASYLANFPKARLYGDITKINENDIPKHDILFAGFPCQPFSITGKQMGFSDTRGTLFFHIERILKSKKPKYIILENVKNLISHDKSRTIKTILKSLNDIGYTVDFDILNAKDFDIPQNRERIYIVGIYKYTQEQTPSTDTIYNIKKDFTCFNFFNTLHKSNTFKVLNDIVLDDLENHLLPNKVQEFINTIKIDLNITKKKEIIKLLDLPKEIHNDLERQRRVYSVLGLSPTILARSDSPKILIQKNTSKYIKKLSPKECFLIQGFSTEFIKNIQNSKISNTQMYKQAGNAVNPPIVSAILKHLLGDKNV